MLIFLFKLHYLYFAIMLFSLTGIVMIIVSLTTKRLESFRLIRTTFWTRKDESSRPDESDYLEKSSKKKSTWYQSILNLFKVWKQKKGSANTFDNQANTIDEQSRCSAIIKQFQMEPETIQSATVQKEFNFKNFLLNLFCGFDCDAVDRTHELSVQNKNETKRRIESFHSLKQTKFEKIALNFNLVLILITSVSLFIFFSIPPQLHIFKHIHLNHTLNIHN